MQQPEAYLGHADKLLDAEGKPGSEDNRKFLTSIIDAFAHWVDIHHY
jgi:chromate reductase